MPHFDTNLWQLYLPAFVLGVKKEIYCIKEEQFVQIKLAVSSALYMEKLSIAWVHAAHRGYIVFPLLLLEVLWNEIHSSLKYLSKKFKSTAKDSNAAIMWESLHIGQRTDKSKSAARRQALTDKQLQTTRKGLSYVLESGIPTLIRSKLMTVTEMVHVFEKIDLTGFISLDYDTNEQCSTDYIPVPGCKV